MPSTSEDALNTLKQRIHDLEHRIHVLEFPPEDRNELGEMLKKLAGLEAESGGPTLDSPTWRKGRNVRTSFAQVVYEAPWTDPPAVQSVAELKAFHSQLADDDTIVATATMPSVDVELLYEEGILTRALLRSDGREGDDITENVRTIPSVPLQLRRPGSKTETRVTKPSQQAFGPSTTTPVPPYPKRLGVRVTIGLRNVDLAALDRRRVDAGDPPYVAPRGAVLASLRRLDSRITASRRLRAVATGCVAPPSGIESQWQLLGALKSWGFAIQPITWRCRGVQEMLDFVAALQQHAPTYDYPLEGGHLVGNRHGWLRQGTGLSATPRVEARLVFPPPGRPAVVDRLYYAVGRGGSILPVAQVSKAPEHDLPVPERAPVPVLTGEKILPVKASARIRGPAGSGGADVDVGRDCQRTARDSAGVSGLQRTGRGADRRAFRPLRQFQV